MINCVVDLKERSYPIVIDDGILDHVGEAVKKFQPSSVLVVTNTTVGPLYLNRVIESLERVGYAGRTQSIQLPDGETYKDLAHIEMILDAAAKAHLDRASLVIALGGGVIGDMAGFAASLRMRGIRFVQIPTTLLAQVDSSVGGKTGVNRPEGKNLIGAFHQPQTVLIDTALLKTLPSRELSAGLAEVIKYGFLGDETFVKTLKEEMQALRTLDARTLGKTIAHCCAMKARIVRLDEKENGIRALLNLGHTFAHAIEKIKGYGTYLHGEAVGIGLVLAFMLSKNLGYVSDKEVKEARDLVLAAGLPDHVEGIGIREALSVMRGDKKAKGGELRFVVLTAVGESQLQTVPESIVVQTLKEAGWS